MRRPAVLVLLRPRRLRRFRRQVVLHGQGREAAYYKASDEGARRAAAFEDYWVDDDYHSHANYVPRESLETCPLTQRANAPSQADQRHHAQGRRAGRGVRGRPRVDADSRTPSITQGALVFGTSAIAE